ncbi:MAG: hypothetical protein QM724_04140 [Flavobacteriales bacterium]
MARRPAGRIRDLNTNEVIASDGPYGSSGPMEVTTPVTIPDAGHFTLRVLDSGNNGMGADGGYVLYDHNGKRVIDNWGNGGGFTSVSESPEGFTTPVGTDGLTAAQCDNVERLANEMIICNVNPLVSAKWGVGDQTTSGYEFWFFDPNGSYSRHILRPHATSGGYAPADATRAAKLGLASWSVNPLPANTLLNVRVRGRVEGVNLPFGPACRLKVDPVAAECHTTQLENLPGSNLSCGVTGLRTNGSNAIYAKPVRRYIAATNTYVSANRYKFHFENTGEGQHFDIVQSTYPMVDLLEHALPVGSDLRRDGAGEHGRRGELLPGGGDLPDLLRHEQRADGGSGGHQPERPAAVAEPEPRG